MVRNLPPAPSPDVNLPTAVARHLTLVPAGSRLRGRVSILEAQDAPPHALRVAYKVAIEIAGGERSAFVAEVPHRQPAAEQPTVTLP